MTRTTGPRFHPGLRYLALVPFLASLWFFPRSYAMETLLVLAAAFAVFIALGSRNREGGALALLFLGLSLMASYWLTLKPYGFLFPGLTPLRALPGSWAAWAGFLLAAASFSLMGKGPSRDDLNAVEAKAGLLVILLAGALFRLWRYREPHPTWGYDPFWEIVDIRNVVELDLHGLIFPLGSREPLFTYLLAPFWWLFPEASPYVVANVGSAVIDLASIWVFYAIGREWGGRRAGLVAAALAATSKPMVIMALACTRGVTVTLGAALVVLLTIRIFKRPGLKRFLQWGFCLALATYTYTGVRILLEFSVLSVLGFAVWHTLRGSRGPRPAGHVAGILTLAFAGGLLSTLDFLGTNKFMGLKFPAAEVIASGWVLVPLLAAAAVAWVLLALRRTGDNALALRHWFLGACLARLLIQPLVSHSLFASNVTGNSVFRDKSFPEGVGVILRFIRETYMNLFVGGLDRPDMNILWDSFFDLLSIPAVLLGMAFFLGRPAWRTSWLVFASAAALLPYVFGVDSHSARVMSALPALFALSAMAFDRAWSVFRTLFPGRITGRTAALVLALLGLAAIRALDGRIWGAFAEQVDNDMALAQTVQREPPGRRIYISPGADFYLSFQQAVQLDGTPAYMVKPENPIYLAQDEPVPPVVVYVYKNPDYSDEELGRARIARAYPEVSWTDVRRISTKSMWRVEIPPDRIREDGGLFHVRRVSGPAWRRVFPAWNYGLGRGGFISREDLVRLPNAPLPPDLDSQVCRMAGPLTVPGDGTVRFDLTTRNIVRLTVAGRKVIDHRPPKDGSESSAKARGSIRLKAGTYPVEMRVYMRAEDIPAVQVTCPGAKEPKLLGEN